MAPSGRLAPLPTPTLMSFSTALPLAGAAGLLLTLAACQQATTADATSSADPADLRAVQANVFTSSGQGHASLAVGPEGRAAVVWDSKRQERGSFGIYARVFDAAGQPRSHELHVNSFLPQAQWLPAAAYAGDGTLWFAWESQVQDGSGTGLVARAFDADGAPRGEELPVNLERNGDQSEVVLAAAGEAMWAAWSTRHGADSRIALRRLDSDGAEFAVPAAAGDLDRLPSLTALADGDLLLAWSRRLADGPEAGAQVLMACRVDAGDGNLGAPFRLPVTEAGDHLEVQVTGLAAGGFAAAWMHLPSAQAPGYEVRVQRFADDGTALAPAQVLADAEDSWVSGVALAAKADGSLAVAWNQDRPRLDGPFPTRSGVMLQRLDAADRRLGAPELLAEDGLLSQHSMAPRLAWTADDRILAAFEGRASSAHADGSAANLALRLPQDFRAPAALALGEAQAATATTDADMLAAVPPIWNPNWVPQGRLPLAASSGGDFGFEGVPGTGWTPPDPELAVGPSDLLVMTNGEITSLSKSGTVRWTDEIEANFGFWGNLGTGGFVFDPEATWDPHARRFLAMACERTSGRSYFLFAISKDDSPDDANDWWKYRFDVTAISGGDIDSPNMSVGPDSILLTADFFGPDKYLIYVIDKSSVLGGGAATTTSELITGSSQQSMGVPTVWSNDSNLYILQSTENSSNNTVILHAITNPFTAYNRVTTTLSVPTYTYPNQPPQKGSSSRPFLFEPRFWSVAERNGSIWAVHHVDNSRARVRWYEFPLNGWPAVGNPTLRQSGEIDLGDGIHTFFPSIAVDGADNAAITFARSANNEYISMGRAVRAAGDPLGEFRPAQVVRTSDNAHTTGRWGDYSGTQSEADVDGVFWGHHEFTSGSTSSWRTWVATYTVEPSPLELTVPNLVGGGTNTISASGASPGNRVFFAYSLTGTGLQEAGTIGAVLSIENANLASIQVADAAGAASISPFIPGSMSGTTVWLQAVEDGGRTSNWEQRTIL